MKALHCICVILSGTLLSKLLYWHRHFREFKHCALRELFFQPVAAGASKEEIFPFKKGIMVSSLLASLTPQD